MACTSPIQNLMPEPSPKLSHNQMALIIADIQIAEAGVQLQNLPFDSMNASYAAYYDFVYKKYNIDSIVFENNYQYYLGNPVEMDSVYQEVITILTTLESESRGIKVIPKTKKSILKL
jgi:hypothetical protein